MVSFHKWHGIMAKFFILGKKMRMRAIIKAFIITFTITTSVLISGCNNYDFSQRIVQQGNLLPQTKIERLTLGMSKNDVAILMGTSLISPLFNNDHWDYAYTWRRGNNTAEIRHVSLYFKNNLLVKIAGSGAQD